MDKAQEAMFLGAIWAAISLRVQMGVGACRNAGLRGNCRFVPFA
jgi:hypothetical protein